MVPAVSRPRFGALLSSLFLLLLLEVARAEEIPFPVERTTILRAEKTVYYVEGLCTIPPGVDISCQKDVVVKGRGKDARIRVEGALKVHGVSDREVIFEGVTVELASDFLDCQLDMCIFRKGGGVATRPEEPARGKLFLEHVEFEEGARIDVTFRHGDIDLSSVCSDSPTRIVAVPPEGESESRVKVTVRGCVETSEHPGLVGGLEIRGAWDASVRLSRIGGELAAFDNCRTLMFDGNKVTARRLEIRQPDVDSFRRVKMMKCDLYCEKVLVHCPRTDPKEGATLSIDRCWWKGIEDPRRVLAEIVVDGEDAEDNAARVRLMKLLSRPIELAGAWDR